MEIETKIEEEHSYVLGQSEAIPVLLRILEMELLIQLEFQLSAHTDVLFIKGITDLARNCFRNRS